MSIAISAMCACLTRQASRPAFAERETVPLPRDRKSQAARQNPTAAAAYKEAVW